MPTIEIDFKDLQSLIGTDLPKNVEELDQVLSYVKGEVTLLNEQEVHVEIGDTNRPDLWNVEGLARALQGFLKIETGLREYTIAASSGVEVHVDPRLKGIRPYIACAVVKNPKISDAAIRGVMQFQDKLDQTYGRRRKRASIGLYDFGLVTPPIRYGVAKPREISFAPLGFEEHMTLEEILQRHPKGLEYGHIVRGHEDWPILMDSEERVLSFPPVINSNDLGRVTEETQDVLIEVTGTAHETVLNTVTAVALSLVDRGGKIHSAEVHYPYGRIREIVTPQLKTQTVEIKMEHINKVLDLKLEPREAAELLERGRFGVKKIEGGTLTVEVPCYRMDVMHPIDLVEDIAIGYGYNNIKPTWPQLPTIGGLTAKEQFCNAVREIMLGLGFQEALTFTMTSPENLFAKMNLKPERVVEVVNPKILTLTCLRNWLLPSLMEFLSHNTHVEYPQRIFEAGYAVVFDRERENQTRDVKKLACVSVHPNANFTEIKSVTDALFLNLGVKYDLEESEHKSFIQGRTGKVLVNGKEIGIIGEIHPRVLEIWKLENPAVALEISLDEISRLDEK